MDMQHWCYYNWHAVSQVHAVKLQPQCLARDITWSDFRARSSMENYILIIKPTRCTNFSNIFLE